MKMLKRLAAAHALALLLGVATYATGTEAACLPWPLPPLCW